MAIRGTDDHDMEIEMLDSNSSYHRSLSKHTDVEDPPFYWRSRVFKKEFKTNLKMAFPVIVTNVMQYLVNIETMAFCGRLPSIELESVGLAISIISALGWCVCTGMASACDTMFAQAFGSEDKKRTGLFLQRGLLVFNLVPIILMILYWNAEPILITLGQKADISRATGEYLITFSPGLIFMMNYIILARYMQDQGRLWPPVVAGVCGNIFNVAAQYVFVMYLGFGFRAAAICHSFSFCVMLISELIYILKTKFYMATWPGFQLEAFYEWWHMFKLGIAGVAHITFSVIFWEGNVFIGGIIGPTDLATQSILMQLLSLLYLIYYGVGMSSNIRVGQCLGANKPNQAKAAYRAGLVNISIGVVIMVPIIISLQNQIPRIYTNKNEVIEMVKMVFPYVYIILLIDPFSEAFNSTLRGCGRQATGALLIFFGFYVVGLPCGLVLAFVYKFGVKGLWIGTSVGDVIVGSLAAIILECQDWKKQAKLAEERILHGGLMSRKRPTGVESQSLLCAKTSDYGERHNDGKHIRTPSYPVTCSIEIVEVPPQRIVLEKSIIMKKIIIATVVLFLFCCGVFLHVFLPKDLYRKSNSTEL